MDYLKRGLFILLAFLLVFTSIPLESLAESNGSEPPVMEQQTEEKTDGPPFVTSEEISNGEKTEIPELRTETTKVFNNGNGTYTKEIYFEPVHKKSRDGKDWTLLSSKLRDSKDGTLVETENSLISSLFQKKMVNGEYASFEINGHKITYSLLEASGEKEPLRAVDSPVTYKQNENQVLHKNVFPKIDLRNLTFDQNVKEDLVLHAYEGYHIFKFKIATSLEAVVNQKGSIDFFDAEDNFVFHLPKPFMADSNLDEASGEVAVSEKVAYDLERTEGGYILTVNADSEWLKNPDRVYPVYIDPSTTINTSTDAFVMSAYPSTNYSSTTSKWDSSQNQYVLKVGYYDSTTGTNYSFLDQEISSLKNMQVTSATLNVFVTHAYYASTANGLWVDAVNGSWSPGSLTWENKPSSSNIDSVSVARDQWASFDVLSTINGWMDGSKVNNGFKLHVNGNGTTYWKKVVSSANSTYKPYLSVTYTIPSPDTPTGSVYTSGDGTGYVNLKWNKVDGATGYKLWVFNGKEYQSILVGNTTSWSTSGKKIWPTESEITSGRYLIHTDELGTDLAVDPSPVYVNSGGNYQTRKSYFFRVSALFSQGESNRSPYYSPTIPDLTKPEPPAGTSFTNGNGTGYIDFNWQPVSGATGYKIYLYNGTGYESVDVGNVTSWSTKGKRYWPTSEEISAGKYNLHLDDNLGEELAVDPSPVYANAGGNYVGNTNYRFRIRAYDANGDTVLSNSYLPVIPSLSIPSPPRGVSYSNQLGSNSGYVNLNWDPVSGATGYKVWIFNGKSYETFDVGDVNHWTTQNQGIWPTPTEITEGKLANSEPLHLHHDKKGVELPVDPSALYAKMGTYYATRTNYWFRVSAYNEVGETVYSNNYFRTSIAEATDYLGEEEYWSFVDVPYGSVNAATGNLILKEEDIYISGRGSGLELSRTFNSRSSNVGLFGSGWHSTAEMSVTGTGTQQAILTDEDATQHIFQKLSDGSYKAPTGVYLELTETTTEFILTDKSQTKFYFNKTDGKINKISDGYGNTTTYRYTNGKLDTIEDASGRKILLTYNVDGFIEKATYPLNRTITFAYQDNLLTKVTKAGGEITQYEYDANQQLIKIFEPTHTLENPVVNQFFYLDGRVTEAVNPNNEKYLLAYDKAKKQLMITQPNSRKDQYSFNEAANPVQITEDVDGLALTTSYIYEGNNLKETKEPNDQNSSAPTESFTYDANGDVITATDSYGTETYAYNSNYDVTSIIDTEGDETTIAYDGLDAISETDQSGKVSSVTKYDTYGNILESSISLGAATNLLTNGGMEEGANAWTPMINTKSSGSITSDTNPLNGLNGSKTLKLTVQSTSPGEELGYVTATQEVTVEPNTTYTLSGKIRTDLLKANAFFNVLSMDSTGKGVGWTNSRYSELTGVNKWTNRQLTFTTPATAQKVRVYLEVDHNNATAAGEAWFDSIQLEKVGVSSSYNPVVNSSFELNAANWTLTGSSVEGTGFDGSKSLKATRTSTTQGASINKQTVNVGQSASSEPINLTLTGVSKASTVKSVGTVNKQDYSISGKVYYTDGTTKDFTADFPIGTQEWNRSAITIPATKPISKIDVSTIFQGNYIGTVWFDAIRILEGSVVTKNVYDTAGNYATELIDELGYASTSKYDTTGNLIEETDAKGVKKSYTYDAVNQLKQLVLSNGTGINYTYDKNGNMRTKSIVDSLGASQSFGYHYDAGGKLTKVTGPLQEVTTYTYDANGNPIKTILPKGNSIDYTYDGTERVSGTSYNGTKYYGFTYDKNGNELSVQYSTENRSKVRTYDASNRLITLTDRGGHQQWSYPTASDKLSRFTFSHGTFSQTSDYVYNELDQNILVKDGTHNYRFDYDERGNTGVFTTGNGAATTSNYDERGLVKNLIVGTADGTKITSETYHYDENGNRTLTAFEDGTTISYSYGELDQLMKETLRDGTTKEYTYDGFGNRKTINTVKGTTASTISSTYNIANQLTKFGNEAIGYDANGNRISDGKFNYDWNAADQLTAVTKVGATAPFATYLYDEDGKRIQKTVDGVVTNYHYDGDSINLLYETNVAGNVTKSYTYSENGQLLAITINGQKFFYHYNAHGDVIALTDTTGNQVAAYEYDAWGNTLKAEEAIQVKENTIRYAGYQFDKETGLYYLMARYYHSEHGVFLALDPDPGDEDDILTQNGYTYANNNPIMLVDPDGHKARIIKSSGKWVKNQAEKAWEKNPYRIKGYSKKDGRLFAVVKRKGKNSGRKFALDYHQVREKINGKKRRSDRKILHAHWGNGENISKHRVIYPRRKNIKWIN